MTGAATFMSRVVLPGVVGLLAGVAAATLLALVLALGRTHLGDGTGLDATLAGLSLAAWAAVGLGAGWHTRRLAGGDNAGRRPVTAWDVLALLAFALFALRAFPWLLFRVGETLQILSPNNLGDLPRHLLYARLFASGVPWWPANPLHAWAGLRYYPGIDLFQSLLLLRGAPEEEALVWAGLLGSAAAAVALWRWGGAFTVAGFLFNGGLAGWAILHTGVWEDYQTKLAWKSLPLAIFVTQRGFLFALPAGLLLMAHWRGRLFAEKAEGRRLKAEGRPETPINPITGTPDLPPSHFRLLPFWVEALLLVALPFFQLFAFLFVIGLLGWWLLVYGNRREMRGHILRLLGVALVPAVGEMWLMTGGFARGRTLWWKPGWMQENEGFFPFWFVNFGLALPLAGVLWLLLAQGGLERLWGAWRERRGRDAGEPLFSFGGVPASFRRFSAAEGFVLPAGMLFVLTCFVMFAPWEWDNTKLMLWSYLATLPFLWERLVARWSAPLPAAVAVALFLSGAVSLVGGLGRQHQGGYELARAAEVNGVRAAVAGLPISARFACSPDYNHPLVLSGRMLAMGYAGALRGYGLDYTDLERELQTLMLGRSDWRDASRRLGVRYVFWGAREAKRYPGSTRPWEDDPPLAAGTWGAIYDLEAGDR